MLPEKRKPKDNREIIKVTVKKIRPHKTVGDYLLAVEPVLVNKLGVKGKTLKVLAGLVIKQKILKRMAAKGRNERELETLIGSAKVLELARFRKLQDGKKISLRDGLAMCNSALRVIEIAAKGVKLDKAKAETLVSLMTGLERDIDKTKTPEFLFVGMKLLFEKFKKKIREEKNESHITLEGSKYFRQALKIAHGLIEVNTILLGPEKRIFRSIDRETGIDSKDYWQTI